MTVFLLLLLLLLLFLFFCLFVLLLFDVVVDDVVVVVLSTLLLLMLMLLLFMLLRVRLHIQMLHGAVDVIECSCSMKQMHFFYYLGSIVMPGRCHNRCVICCGHCIQSLLPSDPNDISSVEYGRRAIECWVVAFMLITEAGNRCCCLHAREGAAILVRH